MQLPPIPPILSPCKFYIIRLPLSVHTCQNFLIKNVVISINPNLIHLHRNYFQFFPFSPKFFFKIYFLNVLYSLFFIMAFQRTGFDCLVFGSGWGSNWSPPPAPWKTCRRLPRQPSHSSCATKWSSYRVYFPRYCDKPCKRQTP